MIRNLGATLKNPASAALFTAIVTLIATYVDHRINRKPDYIVDYMKAMIFNGALVFFIINTVIGGRVGSAQSIMNRPF